MVATTDHVWREFRDRLKRFILKSIHNSQDAEDILQEVFLKIHRHLHTVQDKTKLTAWIYQITRNAIVDHVRHKKAPVEHLEQAPRMISKPASQTLNREIVACLRPMIQSLPVMYREALDLADLKGMTQQQTAAALGLSLPGAKSRVQRARQKLKAMLLDCCHLQSDRYGNILDYEPKNEYCRSCSETPSEK
jgi:RNA polymerase sigma-70 factor (ECF subfamily)